MICLQAWPLRIILAFLIPWPSGFDDFWTSDSLSSNRPYDLALYIIRQYSSNFSYVNITFKYDGKNLCKGVCSPISARLKGKRRRRDPYVDGNGPVRPSEKDKHLSWLSEIYDCKNWHNFGLGSTNITNTLLPISNFRSKLYRPHFLSGAF